MRFFFWLFFVVYWSFLILAPLNTFAADKTFTCKPVVAGSPKKDGSFYVEDIDDESTPMLDVTPISQLLVRGEDVYFKNNPSRKFESLAPYEKVAHIKLQFSDMEHFDNFLMKFRERYGSNIDRTVPMVRIAKLK